MWWFSEGGFNWGAAGDWGVCVWGGGEQNVFRLQLRGSEQCVQKTLRDVIKKMHQQTKYRLVFSVCACEC